MAGGFHVGPPEPEKPKVPVVRGMIRGRRVYGLARFDGDWMLTPAYTFDPENDNPITRSVAVAKCKYDSHPAPQLDCRCGLYAFWTTEEMLKQNGQSMALSGVVEGFGRVIRASKGWRGEKQQLLSLDFPLCRYARMGSHGGPVDCGPATVYRGIPTWLEAYDGHEQTHDEMDVYMEGAAFLCQGHADASQASAIGYDAEDKPIYPETLVVPVETILKDLAYWYECDILPEFDITTRWKLED